MKYPIIPVTESKESESYHKNLYPFRNLLSIEIDIIQKGKDDAGLHASIKNNTEVDLYIPKILDCFRVFRTIIYDENGSSISFVDLSCDTGTGTLPGEAELITLAPKERIEYPGEIPITGYGLLEAGHYSIMLDYFFQPPAVIGGAYIDCGTSAADLREEIDVLNKIVRGRFISSNMVFFNKE